MRTNDTFTENGMKTNTTSLNDCVDFFFKAGAMRGQSKDRLINSFVKAYNEDALTAIKLLFWVRDIRGGAGERQIFKDIIVHIAKSKYSKSLKNNLSLIPEYGRWDDLLPLIDTPLYDDVLTLISDALKKGDALAAKWTPRINVKNSDKKRWAEVIRRFMDMDRNSYRKMLVKHTNVVEQLMCAKEFGSIDYSKLPSKAISDYMKAFSKNDLVRFSKYLEDVDNGNAKINAGAVYPYDIIKNMKLGNENGANTQWNALPNYLDDNNERLLPMVDVSASMETPAGGNGNVTCLDVAISLGLYISEKNEGVFKDAFITFTDEPTIQVLKGSLSERYYQIQGPVGYNTNLEMAFRMVLDNAIKGNVSTDEMPTTILVLSDMEFDCYSVEGMDNLTAQNMIKSLYDEAGYTMPKLVYWNIKSRNDNNPVEFHNSGTCLVSGFSPSLLTNLLGGKEITPYSMMLDVIGGDRYKAITM
jgi:hypothetical protein